MIKKFDNQTSLGIPNSFYTGLIPFGLEGLGGLFQSSTKTIAKKQSIQNQTEQLIDTDKLRQSAAGVKTKQPEQIARSAERSALKQLGSSRGFGEKLVDFFRGNSY
jgi:hypothetical protein